MKAITIVAVGFLLSVLLMNQYGAAYMHWWSDSSPLHVVILAQQILNPLDNAWWVLNPAVFLLTFVGAGMLLSVLIFHALEQVFGFGSVFMAPSYDDTPSGGFRHWVTRRFTL